jgi:hypothetical protein
MCGGNERPPLRRQCDSRWANQRLGTSGQTICQAGCAMSSVAMLLAGRGQNFNPSTLNSWLINHGGYVQGDELCVQGCLCVRADILTSVCVCVMLNG